MAEENSGAIEQRSRALVDRLRSTVKTDDIEAVQTDGRDPGTKEQASQKQPPRRIHQHECGFRAPTDASGILPAQ